VERLREFRDHDHYAPIARHFTDDPHRVGDPLLDELRAWSRPVAVWADIGAGGGRFALPLALANRKVIAVEPSEGMRAVLRESAGQHGIENVEIAPLRWPEGADAVRADFALVAHVGYDLREILPFLDAVERSASERCFWVLMDRAPSGGFTRLWEQVHGEPRRQLPGMREFLHLLLARGAAPDVRILQRQGWQIPPDELPEAARRRLWLSEGSAKDEQLQQLLAAEVAAGTNDWGFPTIVALMHWAPG
jgi:SAM-dependent methyltransferase